MSTITMFGRATAVAAALVAASVLAAPATSAATPPEADLGVAMSARATLLGQQITLTVTVTNNGPDTSDDSGIYIEWLKAYGLGEPTFPAACETYEGPTRKVVLCYPGSLADGATRTFTVRVPVTLLTINQGLDLTANRVWSFPTDPNAENNLAAARCRATTSLLVRC